MEITINDKVQMVYAPSINKLYEALEKMAVAGVDRNAPLVISHLENALGTFAIYELND